MRTARSFRPSVDDLEPRIVPTAPVPQVGAPETISVGAAGTVPVEGNDYYSLDEWEGLHGYFATESTRDRPSVVFLGDSITYGWTSPDPAAHGSAVWAADFEGMGAESYGIPADQTDNVLWRVENGELAGQPQVVVLLIGINDLIHGASPQATTAGIVDDVSAIHAASPASKILVMGLLPTANPSVNVGVAAVNAGLSEQSWDASTTYLNVGSVLLGPGGVAQPGDLFDGLHPSQAGYELLAGELLGPITTMLFETTSQPPTTASGPTVAVETPAASPTSTANPAAIYSEVAPTYIQPIDPTSGLILPATTPKAPTRPAAPALGLDPEAN